MFATMKFVLGGGREQFGIQFLFFFVLNIVELHTRAYIIFAFSCRDYHRTSVRKRETRPRGLPEPLTKPRSLCFALPAPFKTVHCRRQMFLDSQDNYTKGYA